MRSASVFNAPLYLDCLHMELTFSEYLSNIKQRKAGEYNPLQYFAEYYERLRASGPAE